MMPVPIVVVFVTVAVGFTTSVCPVGDCAEAYGCLVKPVVTTNGCLFLDLMQPIRYSLYFITMFVKWFSRTEHFPWEIAVTLLQRPGIRSFVNIIIVWPIVGK